MLSFFMRANNFSKACVQMREAVYGIKAFSQIGPNQFNISTGTAFMIAPGVLITCAHLCHIENNPSRPRHSAFQVIRALDIGQRLEKCTFMTEDVEQDLALLHIDNPRSIRCVKLTYKQIKRGTPVGSLGFPLAFIDQNTGVFRLVERFQGAYISSFNYKITSSGRKIYYHETDSLMYKGSSGCPGFLSNGKVFGMHNASVVEQSPQVSRQGTSQEIRLAISLWVPAKDIIDFATHNKIKL